MVFKKNPLIITNSNSPKMETPGKQSAGILDDFAIRKTIATRQGTIEHIPTDNSDIANKKYVDDSITSIDISGYVPYTGATASLDMGNYSIIGNNLKIISTSSGDTPTATPLYLNTYSENKVTMYPKNKYDQSIWTLADDTFITGDGTIYSNLDGDAYWAVEFVDGYSYLAYGPSGYEIYTNNEETLVCDMYADGTTEWYQNATFDGDIDCATCTVGNGATGSFTTVDSKTVTVTNGIITSIV